MPSKLQPGEFDAYRAALPDEEYFVLLARDKSAPTMLRIWADTRRKEIIQRVGNGAWSPQDIEDLRKCSEADACADRMITWRAQNDGQWREGAERRQHIQEATDAEKAEVELASQLAVARSLAIPSQFAGRVAVESHSSRLWRSPHFNGRVHRLTLKIADPDACQGELKTSDFHIPGQIVADVDWIMETDHLGFLTLYTVVET